MLPVKLCLKVRANLGIEPLIELTASSVGRNNSERLVNPDDEGAT